jgi:Lon protease-like protein
MMDIDIGLNDFSNRVRLFPLPGVVLFPHAILPLHIFEPRYRQMTEDALASDRLVTVVQIQPVAQGFTWSEPVPLMDIACVGRILKYERLADGRFNYLLLGCKRVRLGAEIPTTKPYRTAEAEILEDLDADSSDESTRKSLVELFVEVFEHKRPLDRDLAKLVHSSVALGVLTDIIAHASEFSPSIKQRLLAETRVSHRLEILQDELRELRNGGDSSLAFPPPFSVN